MSFESAHDKFDAAVTDPRNLIEIHKALNEGTGRRVRGARSQPGRGGVDSGGLAGLRPGRNPRCYRPLEAGRTPAAELELDQCSGEPGNPSLLHAEC